VTQNASLASPTKLDVVVEEHTSVARDAGILRFRSEAAPPTFAPGQFLQLRPWGENADPLLARPFSLLDQGTDGEGGWLSVLYQVMGRGTQMMTELRPGDRSAIVAPLGRPFAPPQRDGRAVIVAGGVGIPPFLLVVRDLVQQGREVIVLLGARDAEHLYLREELAAEGAEVRVATDDGSEGHHGLVTDLLDAELERDADGIGGVFTCGPERMMEAVFERARARGVPGQASMERPMACGYGVCFTCVMPLKQDDGSFHNTRTCLAGPVLDFELLPPPPW
jgi:dihydroorotate dehydrogenase electron transfer subunit